MRRMSLLLQSKSTRFTVTRKGNLRPSSRIRIAILQVSQLRCRLRDRRPFEGAWATTPVWALKGAYISANLGACGGVGNIIYFGPLSNVPYWRMRSAAAARTHLCTCPVADSRAVVNHIIKSLTARRFRTCLLAGLWLRADRRLASDWFGGCHLWRRLNYKNEVDKKLIKMLF